MPQGLSGFLPVPKQLDPTTAFRPSPSQLHSGVLHKQEAHHTRVSALVSALSNPLALLPLNLFSPLDVMNREWANDDVLRVPGSQAAQAQGLLQSHLVLPGHQFTSVTGPKVLQSQLRQQTPLLAFLHSPALFLPGLGHCRVCSLSGNLLSPSHCHLLSMPACHHLQSKPLHM